MPSQLLKNKHSSISSSVCWSLKHDFCCFLVIFWAPWLPFPFSSLRSVPIPCVTLLLAFPPAMTLVPVKVSWRSIGNALILRSTFFMFSFNWIISLLNCWIVSVFWLTDVWGISCSASSLEIHLFQEYIFLFRIFQICFGLMQFI